MIRIEAGETRPKRRVAYWLFAIGLARLFFVSRSQKLFRRWSSARPEFRLSDCSFCTFELVAIFSARGHSHAPNAVGATVFSSFLKSFRTLSARIHNCVLRNRNRQTSCAASSISRVANHGPVTLFIVHSSVNNTEKSRRFLNVKNCKFRPSPKFNQTVTAI